MKNFIENHKLVFLFIVIVIACILRFYKLDALPPGVNRDEASIGYTAYSLINTGKDEYGRPFPFSFQSFGDWKLPLYIYTTVPFVKFFGLTEWAVRLPSALAGIATVILTFVLVQMLFKSATLSVLSSLLLTISPWHVHLSRTESESNVAVLLSVIALLFFFKALRQKPKYFIASAIFFALPLYTYAGNHVTTPLFILGLFLIYQSKIAMNNYSKTAIGIFLMLAAFIFFQTLRQADTTKLSGISIFGDPAVIHDKIELPRLQHSNPNGIVARLIHNRILFAAEVFAQNYLKSFAPKFLFISGGTNHAHNIENFGNLYLIEAPFFYFGIVLLFLHRKEKNFRLLLWWLLISPIAASITKDAPHSNRMFAIYPLPPIITALGIEEVLYSLKRKNIQICAGAVIVVLYLVNIRIYLDRYYIHFPKDEVKYWGNGYKDLLNELSQPVFKSKKVVISHPEYSPYIFFLFYSGFDPSTYQRIVVRYPPTEDAFLHVKEYDRFTFRSIDWKKDLYAPNTVLVDFTDEVPPDIQNGPHSKLEIVQGNGIPLFTILPTE